MARILNNTQTIENDVLAGLNFSCSASDHIRTHFNQALNEWYQPLLARGFSFPFFIVFDMGLLFLTQGHSLQKHENRRDCLSAENYACYVEYFDLLYSTFGAQNIRPLCQVFREAVRESLRHQEKREMVPNPFKAALGFVERCFSRFHAVPEYAVIPPQSVKDIKLEAEPLGKIAVLFESGEPISQRVGTAAKTAPTGHTFQTNLSQNAQFLKMFVEHVSAAPSQAGGAHFANSLTDLDRHLISSNIREAGSHRELDLVLMKNYATYLPLERDERFDQLNARLRRLPQPSVLSYSESPEEDYAAIGYKGKPSSLLKRQFGYEPVHFDLLWSNQKLLYYQRLAYELRPVTVKIGVVIDIGPDMRQKSDTGESFYTLAKQVAMFFIEDVGREIGPLTGFVLDFDMTLTSDEGIAFYQSFRFDERLKHKAEQGQRFLIDVKGLMPGFFLIHSPLRPGMRNHKPPFKGIRYPILNRSYETRYAFSHVLFCTPAENKEVERVCEEIWNHFNHISNQATVSCLVLGKTQMNCVGFKDELKEKSIGEKYAAPHHARAIRQHLLERILREAIACRLRI